MRRQKNYEPFLPFSLCPAGRCEYPILSNSDILAASPPRGLEQMVSALADPAGSFWRLDHDPEMDFGFRERRFLVEAAKGKGAAEQSTWRVA
jgi:hypothetical protein